VVAIDGSKFKAVNNRDKNYTVAKVTGRMEQVNGISRCRFRSTRVRQTLPLPLCSLCLCSIRGGPSVETSSNLSSAGHWRPKHRCRSKPVCLTIPATMRA
jgi:hypothetical protein